MADHKARLGIHTIYSEEQRIMSEFEAEVKKAEQELEQGLVLSNEPFTEKVEQDEFLGELKMHAQEYGQKIQDAAGKARDRDLAAHAPCPTVDQGNDGNRQVLE